MKATARGFDSCYVITLLIARPAERMALVERQAEQVEAERDAVDNPDVGKVTWACRRA